METITVNIILSLCCFALSLSLYMQQRAFAKERENYINRIMAKSNSEYITMKKATEDIKSTPKTDSEIIGEEYKRFNGVIN